MDVDSLYLQFGRLLREQRRSHGLSQAELARRVGLARTSVTNIERGRQHIAFHQLFHFADVLGLRPEALLPSRGQSAPSGVEERLQQFALEHSPEVTDWVKRVVKDVKFSRRKLK